MAEIRNYFTATEEGGVDGRVAYRASFQMSCLGSVDVHAGDEVDIGIEEVL